MVAEKRHLWIDMGTSDLIQTANNIRRDIIEMLVQSGTGHTAGPLGISDLFAYLFFGGFLRHRPAEPNWEERDRLILSCGHYAPVLYATLARAGYFHSDELKTLRKLGSRLQGHVVHQEPLAGSSHRQLPGVENTGGPLGQGISLSVGMAIAAKLDKKDWNVVCVTSDGEQQEGQTWEAYMTAAKYELGNLIFFMDRNDIQISGKLGKIMPIEPIKQKYEAFGLRVIEKDGNDINELLTLTQWVKLFPSQPKMIILKTTPGKGVSFMENRYEWHGKTPSTQEAEEALKELDIKRI